MASQSASAKTACHVATLSYTYDTRGRLASAAQGAGASRRVAQFGYGSDGFLNSVTDPIGRTTTLIRDASGRVTEQALPGGRVVRTAYNANGDLTSISPPGRPEHAFDYTPLDQLSTYTSPAIVGEGRRTDYTYGADRMPARVDRADGRAVAFGYDGAGRLTVADMPGDDLSLAYDAASRLSTVGRPGLALAYGYDGSLRTNASWTGTVAGAFSRAYNDDFRLASQSVDSANPIAFQYDNDGLLIGAGSLALTRSAQTGLVTGTTLSTVTDAFGYSPFGQLTSYDARSSGTTIYGAQYARDALGRITRKTETLEGTTGIFDYAYDPAANLVEVRRDGSIIASYTYDGNGNRLTGPGAATSYTYDDRDRLVSATGPIASTFAYTAEGELRTKTTGGQSTTYAYDELGNLVSVTLPSGTLIDYVIDGENRRVGKRVNGTFVQKFLYADGIKPIAELDAADDVVSRFVYSTGVNFPAYVIRGGVTYRILTDHLGSPRLVVDVGTGAVAQRLDYDEFGNVLNDTSPGFQPFGFAGGLYDRDTGLVRFGARDYDAATGRWTARDPGGFRGGLNLYGYADNDPVNLIDPLGTQDGASVASGVTVESSVASTLSDGLASTWVDPVGPTLERVGTGAARSGSASFRFWSQGWNGGALTRFGPVHANTLSGTVGGEFSASYARSCPRPPGLASRAFGVGSKVVFWVGLAVETVNIIDDIEAGRPSGLTPGGLFISEDLKALRAGKTGILGPALRR